MADIDIPERDESQWIRIFDSLGTNCVHLTNICMIITQGGVK